MYVFKGPVETIITPEIPTYQEFYRLMTHGGEPERIEPLPAIDGDLALVGFASEMAKMCNEGINGGLAKIHAVKIVRTVSRLGLKEAKDWVENVADLFPSRSYRCLGF